MDSQKLQPLELTSSGVKKFAQLNNSECVLEARKDFLGQLMYN